MSVVLSRSDGIQHLHDQVVLRIDEPVQDRPLRDRPHASINHGKIYANP